MYDLGHALPVDGVRDVPGGTSLLLSGPPGTGKRDLAMELLAAGQRRADGVVVVTVGMGAGPFRAAYEAADGADDERLRLVDATGFGTDGDRVEAVAPTDLAGLGSALNRSVEPFVTMDTEGLRIGLLSTTAMLDHLDTASVYKFLRTLMGRVDRADYLGVSTVDTAECNEQTVGMMADAFDGVVELRDGTDGAEFRVLGLDGVGTRAWHPVNL